MRLFLYNLTIVVEDFCLHTEAVFMFQKGESQVKGKQINT